MSDLVKKWGELLNRQIASGKTRAEAVRCLARRYPGLHACVIRDTQTSPAAKRLAADCCPEVKPNEIQ